MSVFIKKKKKNTVFLYFPVILKNSFLDHLVFKVGIGKMTGGFMRKEPTNLFSLHEHPEVVAIFTRANWMPFFEKFRGFDEEVAQEFALSLVPHSRTRAIVNFRGISMEITPEFINRVTSLPLVLPWSKDEKPSGHSAKKNFFQPNEHPVEDKNGIRRTSIPYPWDEVSYQIIKYISYEGM